MGENPSHDAGLIGVETLGHQNRVNPARIAFVIGFSLTGLLPTGRAIEGNCGHVGCRDLKVKNLRTLQQGLGLERGKTGATQALALECGIDGQCQKLGFIKDDPTKRESRGGLRLRGGLRDNKRAGRTQKLPEIVRAPRAGRRHGAFVDRGHVLGRHGRITGGGSDAGAASGGRT